MKNVIHIFGGSGSGTTTLGAKIAKELGFTHLDADDYFWLDTDPKYTTKRDKKEKVSMLLKDLEKADNAVITGSIVSWEDDEIIPKFTLAVRIVIDPELRLKRLIQREKKSFGNRIEEGGDMYQNHLDFVAWAEKYDTADTSMRSKALHDFWDKKIQCPIIVIDGEDDLEDNYKKVARAISCN